jgi:hypothetical protein
VVRHKLSESFNNPNLQLPSHLRQNISNRTDRFIGDFSWNEPGSATLFRLKESNMKMNILALASLAAVVTAVPALAQNLNQRQYRQEQRIRQGERNGQLTPAEARRLQYMEMELRRTEARLRSRNGGQLSWQERRRLQAMERRDSAEIQRLKHNYRRY